MRITIVQGAFLPVPPLLGGAVEKVWEALGREFALRGHQVTHISRRFQNLPVSETVDGVHHRRVGGFNSPKNLVHLKFLDLLYSANVLRQLPRADVLVTNTFWLPMLVRDASRGRIYVHVARYPKGQIRFYSRAARLQTVSQSVGEAIVREAPQLASRMRVIPYPLIENHAGLSSAGPLNPEREKQILFVGRVHPEKGVDLLIRAFRSIRPECVEGWRLVIVGPSEIRLGGGGEDYLRHLKDLASPVADKVDWVGQVFEPLRLAEIYRRAAIFAYPSLADLGETFGLAPLEAMAQGCAPVVSDLACFREFLENGVDGLVFNHHGANPAQDLADQLVSLTTNAERRARFGAAATAKSRAFGLERIVSLFEEDFGSLLNPGSVNLTAH